MAHLLENEFSLEMPICWQMKRRKFKPKTRKRRKEKHGGKVCADWFGNPVSSAECERVSSTYRWRTRWACSALWVKKNGISENDRHRGLLFKDDESAFERTGEEISHASRRQRSEPQENLPDMGSEMQLCKRQRSPRKSANYWDQLLDSCGFRQLPQADGTGKIRAVRFGKHDDRKNGFIADVMVPR